MAYMNLMYRERADIQCEDPSARAADLKTADEWVDKTMATKKAKAEKQPGAQGITMDQGNKHSPSAWQFKPLLGRGFFFRIPQWPYRRGSPHFPVAHDRKRHARDPAHTRGPRPMVESPWGDRMLRSHLQ